MTDQNEWEAREADLSDVLKQALRRETPAGLSNEQRARLRAASRAAEKPRWKAWLAATAFALAAACAALIWFELDRQEHVRLEQEAEREYAEEQRQRRLEEKQRAAEQEQERAAVESRARVGEEEASRAAEVCRHPISAMGAPVLRGDKSGSTIRGKARGSAKASAGSGTGKASTARAGCDPNDPLCGL